MSTIGTDGIAGAQIIGRGNGYVFAVHQNVVIAIWAAQGTGPLVAELARAASSHARAHPEGFSSLHLVAKGTPLADSGARSALVALMHQYEQRLACIGTVLEGSGFWASATQSLILGMRLLAPRSFEMQTYASIPALATWLPAPHAKRTGVKLDPGQIERIMTELRALV
jgi:hypothetical protein